MSTTATPVAEAAVAAAHDRTGRCLDPRTCLAQDRHARPSPLPGPRVGPNGDRFTWGPVTAIHTIGEYAIVEYRQDRSNHSASQPWCWDDHGKTLFHPYVAGRDTNRSYASLDSALVGAIGYRREGPNGSAADYFDRMTSPRGQETSDV